MQRIYFSFSRVCTTHSHSVYDFDVSRCAIPIGEMDSCWIVGVFRAPSTATDGDDNAADDGLRNMDDRWNGKSADRHHFKRNIDRKWICSNLFCFWRFSPGKNTFLFEINNHFRNRIFYFHFIASDDSSSHILGSSQLWFLLLSENTEKKKKKIAEWPIEWKSRVSTFTLLAFEYINFEWIKYEKRQNVCSIKLNSINLFVFVFFFFVWNEVTVSVSWE